MNGLTYYEEERIQVAIDSGDLDADDDDSIISVFHYDSCSTNSGRDCDCISDIVVTSKNDPGYVKKIDIDGEVTRMQVS